MHYLAIVLCLIITSSVYAQPKAKHKHRFASTQKKNRVKPLTGSTSLQQNVIKPTTVTTSKSNNNLITNKLYNITDSVSYALGINVARNLNAQGFGSIDPLKLYKGLSDILLNKQPQLTDEQAALTISKYTKKPLVKNNNNASIPEETTKPNKPNYQNTIEETNKNKTEGRIFLAENSKKPNIVSMPGGWQYEIIKSTKDTVKPKFNQKVLCHYVGTLINGIEFENSHSYGEPVVLPVNSVIMAWQMALPMMTVGSIWKLYVPSSLAYGDTRRSELIGPGTTLIFEIELLGVVN